MERMSPSPEMKTQQPLQLPEATKVDQASVMTSPMSIVWNMTAAARAWWSGSNTVYTDAFTSRFNGIGQSPAQQLVHLFDHASLGWNLKEPVSAGALAYYEGLLEDGESGELKKEFLPFFQFMQQAVKINTWQELIQALHQPSKPEHQKIIGAFSDALRLDPTYLQEVTEGLVASTRVSFEEKMVHLHLFLSTEGVLDENAAAVLGKLPEDQQDRLRLEEEWETVIGQNVAMLRDQVGQLRTHLAMCQVIRGFQDPSQNWTVSALYGQLPEEGGKRDIRAFQEQVMKEMDIMGSRITIPGAKVQGWFGTSLGAQTFDYFDQDPSGDIAKGAIDKMIAHLQG
ncbi:MAG: hypothetical protein KFB93_07030 [Simkaniaceae bacterium]|nr:MAG: hypothetical protein KFB93_07030 [Simkaniaceae bacterium]